MFCICYADGSSSRPDWGLCGVQIVHEGFLLGLRYSGAGEGLPAKFMSDEVFR